MSDYSDWEIVPEENEWVIDESPDMSSFMQQQPQEQEFDAGIFGDPEAFRDKMENFYRTYGIHGANRGFAKLFSLSGSQHQQDTQQRHEQALETNPWANEAGNIAAQLYGSIPFMQLAGSATGGMSPGIAKTAAIGGLGSAAKAGYESPYGNETRLGNVAKEGIGGAVLAGGGHLAAKGIGKGATLLKQGAQSKEKIAQSIANPARELKAKYSGPAGLFEEFIERAEQQGIKGDLPFTSRTSKIINKELDGVNKAVRKAVIKAHKTNDVRDIMAAESKLGKFKRAQFSNAKRGAILDQDAIDSATFFENKLGAELERALAKQNPGLGEELKSIRKGYKEELVPYLENPAIQKFLRKKSASNDLVRSLRGNSTSGESFRAQLADKHPEIAANHLLANLLKGTALGAPVIGGLYGYIKK